MLIILGVITFHYYAYVSVGKRSAFNVGAGVNVMLLPTKKQEYFVPSPVMQMPTPVTMPVSPVMHMPTPVTMPVSPVMQMPVSAAPSVGELENRMMELAPMAFDKKCLKCIQFQDIIADVKKVVCTQHQVHQ